MTAKDEADACAVDLLLLYEALGIRAVVVTLDGREILARCQDSADVLPLCKYVLDGCSIPEVRTVN